MTLCRHQSPEPMLVIRNRLRKFFLQVFGKFSLKQFSFFPFLFAEKFFSFFFENFTMKGSKENLF